MRLLQLSANKASFKTIPFNHTGISLIVAKQKTDEKRNTYNSVGKSLAIALVHFCLGSNPIKDLEEKLNEYKDDINMTNKLVEIGYIQGIFVLDHMIIGNKDYYSFYENNMIGK